MTRHRHREVTPRTSHPCYWCPEPIEAGHRCDSWAACDCEALNEIAEALGADDIPPEPDQGCIPRMIGFWGDREKFGREVAAPP